MNKDLRIVFMGTPDFAVPMLDILLQNNYNVVGVVTVPDKPAGRGQKLMQSAVKLFALKHNLYILQPEKLKDESFVENLRALNADLQIVVAFRMLPELIWKMPKLGTINLHASLLPQYRGAAPINWAVINGEKETGVTTFFIQHEIDTGNIIFQEKVSLEDNDTAGEMYIKLMGIGAELVLRTVKAIETGNYKNIEQKLLYSDINELKAAPKIFKEDCKIDWSLEGRNIFNKIRGLSPYPAAWTEFVSQEGETYSLKVFKSVFLKEPHSDKLGSIVTDNKSYLKIAVKDGYVFLSEIQLSGKKRMPVEEFLKGFKLNNNWKAQ